MRLGREVYLPGFTIGGGAELLGIVALVALLMLIGMQVVYWLVTHPVNSVWIKDLQLRGLAARFVSTHDSSVGDDCNACDTSGNTRMSRAQVSEDCAWCCWRSL